MYGLWAKRVPWIFWGELPGFERRGNFGRLLRWLALRPVACLTRGVAAIGSRAAQAYAKLTKNACPVQNIPYYCRIEAFLGIDRGVASGQEQAGEEALKSAPHFLYCGQIVHARAWIY